MRDYRIKTYCGKLVNPFNLQPDDICLGDVAHSLSLQARFTGHTDQHWSIAQHSLLVAFLCPFGFRFDALNHDDEEAYTNDISSPFKRHWSMWYFRRNQKKQYSVIAKVFRLIDPVPKIVHEKDKIALAIEQYHFMNGNTTGTIQYIENWEIIRDHVFFLKELSMKQIEQLFISNFYLYKQQERGEV